jgi:hypothetical protein
MVNPTDSNIPTQNISARDNNQSVNRRSGDKKDQSTIKLQTLIWRMHKLGKYGREQKNLIRLPTSLQSIPKYVEVLSNIEAKRIILYGYIVLFY